VSFDYEVVVKARERTRDKLRELAARIAKSYEGTLVDHDDDESDDDDLDVHVGFPNGGGTIEITRLERGYRLYLDSQRDGNRDSWDDIAGLANDIAAQLGEIVEGEVAAQMIEESEPEDVAPAPSGPVNVAVVRIEDRGNALLSEVSLDVAILLRAVDAVGMLRDIAEHPALTEEGRYNARAARLVATLHGSNGEPYRRHRWSCDGYGRIIGADVEELDD